ncbi:MAG: ATP-binding protein [Planctomycetes bacterium]|nr:ATP-binding protein [Planctomycetota bacterium]
MKELVCQLPRERTTFSLVVLHGPAGSGKTTALMRAAQIVSSAGPRVFFANGLERLDLRGILDFAEEDNGEERIFIFIDVISRHVASIDAVYDRLIKLDNVTLVVADRSNKYAGMSHAFAALNPVEVRMPDLDEDDVKSIIAKLEEFGFLGVLREKTPEQRTAAFMDSAKKQLLVALREATSGQGFDMILRTEYADLAPAAQLAYTICCIAVAHGAPGVYIRHLLPCLGRSEFTKGVVIRDLLRGVLVPANQSETMVRPRHRLIAYWVATEIAPVGQKVEAVGKFLWQISSDIVPNEIKRRSPAYVAYRGMINSEALRETFSNDTDIILGIYDELKAAYGHDFLFWLHYGMAQINAGRLDVAENYINQSLAINPRSHQSKHHLGCLHLLQASTAPNPAAVLERANSGIDFLLEQIRTHGDENSYPYHAYLVYVCRWYRRADNLISQKQWEGLRQIGTEAIKKFPRDDMVKDATNEVERQYLLRVAVDREP